MPQITLKRPQVEEIVTLAHQMNREDFFVAKDDGAYVGIAGTVNGEFKNAIFYFKGCNPKRDPDSYETARVLFGGDDFGEFLSVQALEHWLRLGLRTVTVKVTASRITMQAKLAAR